MINTRTVHLSGGGRAVTFDVTPESIKTSEPMISKKKELLAGGYLYVGAPGLRSRSIDTFIPAASEILEIIESWRVYGQLLTVAITGLETIAMKITDMSTTVKEGDADIWISLTLTEADATGVTASRKTRSATEYYYYMRRQTGTADGKIMHKVKKGDTIYKLAKRYYGDTKLWAAIYTANRKKIGSNYKQKLKPGLKIAIPLPEVKP